MTWELREAKHVEAAPDDSGVYAVINRVAVKTTHKEYSGEVIRVRLDLMTSAGDPIMSWIGSANNVRKHAIAYIDGRYLSSREHASYIGYELLRAETDPNYVQD